MQHQRIATVCIVAFLIGAVVVTVLSGQKQVDKKQQRPDIDFTHFPIVDLEAPQPSDATERAKRTTKAKKYNGKHGGVINESMNRAFLVNESLVDLPALPVERSSAVILGEITSAAAYLSEDKTQVYSEFAIRIQAVLKNDTSQNLNADTSIEADRFGGRVRLPSGKIFISAVDNQDMPHIGGRYLLFLTHSNLWGGNDQDYHILMGYEIRGGKVFPLDLTSPTNPISRYEGRDEAVLLTDLSSALARVSRTTN
jgi:hypothetical protein